MAKIKYTFKHADGHTSTRSSERPYTHVVVGRIDLAAWRARLIESQSAGENWDFTHAMAQKKVGDRMFPDRPWVMKQEDVDKYQAELAANPDRAAYIAKRHQEGLASIEKQHGAGAKSPEGVLQWSMSAANAAKGAQSKAQHYVDVAVHALA
jgi:hypothetical protein